MAESEEKKLLLIDTDAGLDDAQAILMALASPNVTIVGITTVSGNTNSKQVAKNVLRLLRVANRLEIPIYTGTEKPLVNPEDRPDSNYHGKDGFGDVYDDNPADIGLLKDKHGVQALLDISKEYEGKVTLVALGPLTNIALAIRLDPEFGKRLKACSIMGGNYKGEGNITPSAEFNFYYDPEAARIVLNELGCQITLSCWELCTEYSLTWEWHAEIFNRKTDMAEFVRKLEHNTVEEFYKAYKMETYHLADQYAMAAVLDENVITSSVDVYSTVELTGQTRGQMIVDWKGMLKRGQNVKILTCVDLIKIKDMLHCAFR